VTPLAAMATNFRHRNSLDAQRTKCFTHFFELEWLDDSYDEFHSRTPICWISFDSQESCQLGFDI
jgi:hypothetical protein